MQLFKIFHNYIYETETIGMLCKLQIKECNDLNIIQKSICDCQLYTDQKKKIKLENRKLHQQHPPDEKGCVMHKTLYKKNI